MDKISKEEITKAITQRLSEQPELEDGEPYAYEIGFDDGVKWAVEQMTEHHVLIYHDIESDNIVGVFSSLEEAKAYKESEPECTCGKLRYPDGTHYWTCAIKRAFDIKHASIETWDGSKFIGDC